MFVRAVTRSCNALGAVRKCSTEKLEKTAFYDLHLSLGGKMVPFAGYSLPVQYEGLGVLKEHVHTRSADGASLFDVSHMGQIKWTGKDAVAFIEKMTVCDVKSLKVGEAKLSLVMNEKGTIMDDTVITNAGDHLYMVVNGACKVRLFRICVRARFLFAHFTKCTMSTVEGHGPLQALHEEHRHGRPHGLPGRPTAARRAGA
jgi:glycine cleavage system aminomethyltransferase T